MKKIILFLLCSSSAFALGGCGTGGGPYSGFGSAATGGTTITTVTNLNDSGAGSFRAAVGTAGACVKFSVSGTISLSSIVTAATGVTIDGFSAPNPGITITCPGDCVQPSTTGNLIVQGIRIKNAGNDCFHILQGHDLVFDHVAINACGDGNIDFTIAAHDATVSWSLIANNQASGASLTKYGAYHISYHHNLWYKNIQSGGGQNTRVPWIEGDSDCCVTYVAPGTNLGINADIEWNVFTLYTYGMLMATDGTTLVYGNIVGNLGLDDDGNGRFKNFITISGGSHNLTVPYIAGNASKFDERGQVPSWGELTGAFTLTNANTLDCTSTGLAAGVCQATSPYATPSIPGPCLYDVTTTSNTRIAEWTNVKNHAGLIDVFPDDSQDAASRAGVTIPTATALFTGAVGLSNTQTGNCNAITPLPAPASALFAFLHP